jgi:hypothetical protein
MATSATRRLIADRSQKMRRSLVLHPDCRCDALRLLEVEAARPQPDLLELRFRLEGEVSKLRLPPLLPQERTDRLWEHSCLEAFVRPDSGQEYYELNFAPSSQWAAYRFAKYRSGMVEALEVEASRIECVAAADLFEVSLAIRLSQIAEAAWRVALSAVIEEEGDRKSYWALHHPPGKADFHHPDSFILKLPA